MTKLSDFQLRLAQGETRTAWHSDLTPLFESPDEYARWVVEKQSHALRIAPLTAGEHHVALGIDSGSTTTKIVVLEMPSQTTDVASASAESPSAPHVLFTHYAFNKGNPVQAVSEGLTLLKEKAAAAGATLLIEGSCSTGYGEELIKAAFNLDKGIIETIAHLRAATSLMPAVSFILDIGGQDMKAIFVDHGAVVRMELNEACSSGCGTFIQTFASSLGYSVEEFAQLACTASQPCDLGTRCTVFMNSKVKQVLRDGATIADISAGLAYSVIKNCLYKVLKLHGNEEFGQRIVVQGGTMRNDAVVRAFELLTYTHVARSSHPELMGALGCALTCMK